MAIKHHLLLLSRKFIIKGNKIMKKQLVVTTKKTCKTCRYKKEDDSSLHCKDCFAEEFPNWMPGEEYHSEDDDLPTLNPKFEEMKQYYFDRDDFELIFNQVFGENRHIYYNLIFDLCTSTKIVNDFFLFRDEDEFYILHLPSGVMINWYKHLGRTNTCNKEGVTERDLTDFFSMLQAALSEVY